MKGRTVLLVLDEVRDLLLYGNSLHERGYATLLCGSPGEGINSLESESVALVIVGQETPGFEGRQVLEHSLRLYPQVPVVVVARVLDMHYYLDAMELGAADYLERPDPRDVVWAVDTYLPRAATAQCALASPRMTQMKTQAGQSNLLLKVGGGNDGAAIQRSSALDRISSQAETNPQT